MRIAGVLIPAGGAAQVPVTDFEPLDHVRLTRSPWTTSTRPRAP